MRFLREGQTLNKVEKIKLQRHPLDVQQSIIDTYSKDFGHWCASRRLPVERSTKIFLQGTMLAHDSSAIDAAS